MIDQELLVEVLELGERRRAERRRFLKMAGAGATAIGGASLLAACGGDDADPPPAIATPAPTPTSSVAQADIDVLNFALNLEYLEANYYTFGAFGSGLNGTLTTGVGTQGSVTGGRQVSFSDASVANYIREIAQDENEHVTFIRSQLGSVAVAQPALNIDGGASGAFTAAARSAGLIGATETFDPYANDENFLLGAMLLTDVGVTAYKGSARLIQSGVILEAAAGILAVEAYHSGLLRTLLYARGLNPPASGLSTRQKTDRISDARDALDGPADLDQGVSPQVVNGLQQSNIVPTDADGIVFGRTAPQVLNIAYLNKASVTAGGFFPSGVNGNIKASAANG